MACLTSYSISLSLPSMPSTSATSCSSQSHPEHRIWFSSLPAQLRRRSENAPLLCQFLQVRSGIGSTIVGRVECIHCRSCVSVARLNWHGILRRRRIGRGLELQQCRAAMLEPAVRLVLAEMDPENLQTLIIGASVLVATSASLYYGLKVISRNSSSFLRNLVNENFR